MVNVLDSNTNEQKDNLCSDYIGNGNNSDHDVTYDEKENVKDTPSAESVNGFLIEDAAENNSELNSHSEDNEWLDVIGTGGLKLKVLEPGISDTRPQKGDHVRISAIGRLENGEIVDVLKETEFNVGAGEVIHGLDMVMELMVKGEICEAFLESRLAYGELGFEPDIPPNSNLFYKIELLDCKNQDDLEEMPIQERLSIGIRKRERGNWWFRRKEYEQSIKCYKSAVDFLDDTSDTFGEELTPELRELLEERLKTMNNMAAAQMMVGALDIALVSIESILSCQPNNVKALYRKGKILGLRGEAKRGLDYLMTAISIEPSSKVIQTEIAKLRDKAKKETETEKSLYRKMLGINSDFVKTQERYPTLRLYPFKVWGIIFGILLAFLLGLKYTLPYFTNA